jgi:hypothetical protein
LRILILYFINQNGPPSDRPSGSGRLLQVKKMSASADLGAALQRREFVAAIAHLAATQRYTLVYPVFVLIFTTDMRCFVPLTSIILAFGTVSSAPPPSPLQRLAVSQNIALLRFLAGEFDTTALCAEFGSCLCFVRFGLLSDRTSALGTMCLSTDALVTASATGLIHRDDESVEVGLPNKEANWDAALHFNQVMVPFSHSCNFFRSHLRMQTLAV